MFQFSFVQRQPHFAWVVVKILSESYKFMSIGKHSSVSFQTYLQERIVFRGKMSWLYTPGLSQEWEKESSLLRFWSVLRSKPLSKWQPARKSQDFLCWCKKDTYQGSKWGNHRPQTHWLFYSALQQSWCSSGSACTLGIGLWLPSPQVMGFGWDTSLVCCQSRFPSVRNFLAIWKAALICSQFFSLDRIIFQAYPLWFPRGAVKQQAKPNLEKSYYLWGFLAGVLGKMVFKLDQWAYYPATPQTSLWSWDEDA